MVHALPPPVLAWLDKVAAKETISRSAVVRQLLIKAYDSDRKRA